MNTPRDEDDHELSEAEVLEQLRQRLVGAVQSGVGKLKRAARGNYRFGNDHEFHACVALSRLAPLLLGCVVRDPPRKPLSLAHPALPPEQAARIRREWLQLLQREQGKENFDD